MAGEGLQEADSDVDAENVWEERRQPDHSHEPARCLRKDLAHPGGDSRLEEGQRDVGHDQGTGADGDHRIHEEFPHGCALDTFAGRVGGPSSTRLDDHEDGQGVGQTDESQDEERHWLAGDTVEDGAERRSYEATERDEGQGYAKGGRSLTLLVESVGNHGQARGVGEG